MSTYDTDFYRRAQAQAAAIRAKQWAALDLDHVAEGIERWGIADGHAITRQLRRLLLHLRKWRYQPTHRTWGRRRSIRQARDAIADRLEHSPSLRGYLVRRLPLAYRRARRDPADETGLPLATFPGVCPWPVERVLDEDFWSEGTP